MPRHAPTTLKSTHFNRRTLCAGGSLGLLGSLLSTTPLYAASATKMQKAIPAIASHWGSFTLTFASGPCLQVAEDVLTNNGYTIYQHASANEFFVVGLNDTISIDVTTVPLSSTQTYVIVIASSDDYDAAAAARNTIRQQIQDVAALAG